MGASSWRPGPDVFSNYDVMYSLLLLLCLACDVCSVGGLCEQLTSILEIPTL
jgi:hypothetical protein